MRTRAAVLEDIGRDRPYADTLPLSVDTVDLDPPGWGEMLVRIEAAGVCHSDLSVLDGNRPRPTPMALGHEAAAVIVELGPGVVGAEEGDHVVLTFVPACGVCAECHSGRPALCRRAAVANTAGTLLRGERRLHRRGEPLHHHLGVSAFAEYAVVDRGSAVVIPRDIPLTVAALLGCAVLTGFGAVVNTARARPGQSIAVFGLGGIGLSALMTAAVTGHHPIIAIDPIESKRKLAIDLGADTAYAPGEALLSISEVTDGGVDIGIEAVGHAAVLTTALASTRRRHHSGDRTAPPGRDPRRPGPLLRRAGQSAPRLIHGRRRPGTGHPSTRRTLAQREAPPGTTPYRDHIP